MGPRLPGDRGPQPRPKEKALTHNPFAALAAKLEGGGADADRPAEAPEPGETAPETSETSAAPADAGGTPHESAPAEAARSEAAADTAPSSGSAPAGDEAGAPAPGGEGEPRQ
jgi:3'-5' exoribonuclease